MTIKADNVRGVAFPPPAAQQPDILSLWQLLKVGDAMSFTRGQPPAGASQVTGTVNDFQLRLSVQLGRLDLIITPTLPQEAVTKPAQISNLHEAMVLLERSMISLCSAFTVLRLAIIVEASELCDSEQQATQRTSELSGTTFPNYSTDHIIQFNLRRKFSNSDFQMNRLATWSTGTMQMFSGTITFTPNAPAQLPPTAIFPISSLKVDVNSATQERLPDVGSMIKEMIQENRNILQHGRKAFDEQ